MISVVVPTLNEARNLPRLLDQLAAETAGHEVIVVDGGSDDGTDAVARRAGVRLLPSAPGRGQQLAAGAAAARGEILLFLHADSRFPAGGLMQILETLAARPACPGGNFRLVFDGDTPFSRWLTGFYARIRGLGFYYGDSAVFVRRSAYEEIGGIRQIALMEDYDFARRLERKGRTCCIEDPPLTTSSRRFEGRRPVAIVWGWIEIHLLFHLGVPPAILARRYEAQRRRGRRRTAARRGIA
ncbi:MAG: TIGR04283 family arsenosugar biosynthesis glycosyltransferase [Kiloniellales bacterium]|nr:TIGR04283 family arsenosugar biosynthesis glycosyltransferase [Kiloniellales bacterium]